MTGATADRFALANRGYLRPGCAADAVVFDPAAAAPGRDLNGRPLGIRRVMVKGLCAVKDGAYGPGSLHGQFLLK